MEKIKFMSEEMNEEVDVELSAVLKVFEELLEDVEIER